MTVPPLGGADRLPRRRRAVYDALAELPERIRAQRSKAWGLGAPPDREPGELLLDQMPNSALRRMAAGSGPAEVAAGRFLDGGGPVRTEGMLYLTDRRAALMGNRRRVIGQWRWDDVAGVRVLADGVGVEFLRSAADSEADVVLHHVNKLLVPGLRSPIETAWRHLLTAEACWTLATGRDWNGWLSLVPARLGA